MTDRTKLAQLFLHPMTQNSQEVRGLAQALIDSEVELTASRQECGGLRESVTDNRRLTRELDVAMHGKENAAKQASLCDLIVLAQSLRERAESAEADNIELQQTINHLQSGDREEDLLVMLREAKAKNASLAAQVAILGDALRHALLTTAGWVDKAEKALTNLPAEAQKLARDAERYRWLRLHSYVCGEHIDFGAGYDQTEPKFLDLSIDRNRDLRGGDKP